MRKLDYQAIKTIDPKALYTVGEVAKFLGVAATAVRKWIHAERIQYGRIGSRYIIRGSEIQKQVTLPEKHIDL
jgi:excisionase family DNA binding protein